MELITVIKKLMCENDLGVQSHHHILETFRYRMMLF